MNKNKNINETPKLQTDASVRFEAGVMLPPNTFLNADCMDYLPKCPAGYFDLAIVDPPYGIDYDEMQNNNAESGRMQNGGAWKKYHKTNWDASPPASEYFRELFRVSKNQVIWGGNFFLDDLPKTKCMLIWDKVQRDNRADCEIAWTSFDKPSKVFRMSRADAYINKCDFKIHPCQKPVELYRWILDYLGRAGDLILDTHVGSANSVVACIEKGYDYVGFEIDKIYYGDAERNVRRAFRKYELNFEQNEAAT